MAKLNGPTGLHLVTSQDQEQSDEPEYQEAVAATGDYFESTAGSLPMDGPMMTSAPSGPLAPLSIRDVAMEPISIEERASQPMQLSTRPMGMNLTNRSYPMSGLGQASASSTFLPLLLAGGAAVAGGMYGGGWGALAGLLLTGSLTNAYRFMANADGERTAHGTFAVVAAAGGGYAAYKVYKTKKPGREQ